MSVEVEELDCSLLVWHIPSSFFSSLKSRTFTAIFLASQFLHGMEARDIFYSTEDSILTAGLGL